MAVPYQARHSGASIDAALSLRTRGEAEARERWASEISVTRFESKARLSHSVPAVVSASGGVNRTGTRINGYFADLLEWAVLRRCLPERSSHRRQPASQAQCDARSLSKATSA